MHFRSRPARLEEPMCVRSLVHRLACAILVVGVTCLTPELARAHCDGLDGPVSRRLSERLKREIPPLLIWVRGGRYRNQDGF